MDIYEAVSIFYKRFRGEKHIYGRSADGRNLYAMLVGSRAGAVGISQYGMHAREWITAMLGLEHIRRGVTCGGVWVLPLTNPDGAVLVQKGLESVSGKRRAYLKALNGGEDFSLWKANAEGVDLNVNFPARWGTGAKNRFSPAPENYVGIAPLCAPESRAIADFTQEAKPAFTVSWHTKGEEIYWRFHQPLTRLRRDKKLALALSEETGYPLGEAKDSAGGYKDWCVETLKISAFTVEAGKDSFAHPLGFSALPDLIDRNLDALVKLNGSVMDSSPKG